MGALVTALGVQRTMLVPGLALIGLVWLSRILPRPGEDPAIVRNRP
jgi:hypothetical protein